MKVFVTGASGFIGSKLCSQLTSEVAPGDITCLVREEVSADRYRALGYNVVQSDLADIDSYRHELLTANCVFHLGGLATFGNSLDYERDNVEATRLIVEALESSEVVESFIFTSTIGAVDRTPGDSCAQPLNVASTPCPQSAYGKSKLRCEEIVRSSNTPWVIVRPAWVYGPGMRIGSHIATFVRAAMNQKLFTRIRFPGRVSVIYIDDMAGALVHAMKRRPLSRVLFACDGEPRSLGEIFEAIYRSLNMQQVTVFKIPGWIGYLFRQFRRFLPFMVQNLFSDVLTCTGADLEDIGYHCRTSFQDGILNTVKYFKDLNKGRCLVTGAASGIGREFARELADAGCSLYLVDLDREGLKETAEETGGAYLALNLAQPEACREIRRWVDGVGEPVSCLINNAGVGIRGNFAANSADRVHDLIMVNFGALAGITREFLPDLKRRGGRILNIASSVSFAPLPGMAVYAASKAAVLHFSEALWAEMRGTGVSVTCVCPSGTLTQFQRSAGVRVLNEGRGLMSPRDVARLSLKAMESGKMTCVIGWKSRVLVLISTLLPRKLRVLMWQVLMKGLR